MCWHGWYQIFKQLPAIVPRGSIVQIETMTAQRQERNGAWRRRAFCPRIALIALWAVACLVASSAVHATTTERVVVNRFSGLAIEGYDPVAYFAEAQPVKGLPDFEASQAGAIWRFHNEGNRASFVAHPEIYDGSATRVLQAYLGHKNIQHTVRYTELAPTRFKDFWRD